MQWVEIRFGILSAFIQDINSVKYNQRDFKNGFLFSGLRTTHEAQSKDIFEIGKPYKTMQVMDR